MLKVPAAPALTLIGAATAGSATFFRTWSASASVTSGSTTSAGSSTGAVATRKLSSMAVAAACCSSVIPGRAAVCWTLVPAYARAASRGAWSTLPARFWTAASSLASSTTTTALVADPPVSTRKIFRGSKLRPPPAASTLAA